MATVNVTAVNTDIIFPPSIFSVDGFLKKLKSVQ